MVVPQSSLNNRKNFFSSSDLRTPSVDFSKIKIESFWKLTVVCHFLWIWLQCNTHSVDFCVVHCQSKLHHHGVWRCSLQFIFCFIVKRYYLYILFFFCSCVYNHNEMILFWLKHFRQFVCGKDTIGCGRSLTLFPGKRGRDTIHILGGINHFNSRVKRKIIILNVFLLW